MSNSIKIKPEYTPAILQAYLSPVDIRALAESMRSSAKIQAVILTSFHYSVTRKEIFAAEKAVA